MVRLHRGRIVCRADTEDWCVLRNIRRSVVSTRLAGCSSLVAVRIRSSADFASALCSLLCADPLLCRFASALAAARICVPALFPSVSEQDARGDHRASTGGAGTGTL